MDYICENDTCEKYDDDLSGNCTKYSQKNIYACDDYIGPPFIEELSPAPKNNEHEGKPKPTLIPMDVLLKYLEPAYAEGVEKYKRESWRQGFNISTLMDAAFRHMIAFYYEGEDIDPDSSTQKTHLSGALFSIISALHTLETRPELDDRFSKKQEE